MTEHTHKPSMPVEEVKVEINDGRKSRLSDSPNLIAASILIGSILIAASVFYNTKIVLQRLDKGTLTAKSAQQDAGDDTQPSGQDQAQGPVKVPERQDAPVIGSNTAKVTLVEFSDFQCPFCAKFYKETFNQIKTKYIDSGKVKFVYRHFPLPSHQNAQKAAEAAECANRQGKFEAFHTLLFTKGQPDGTGLAVADLKQYAVQAGLNASTFNRCLDNGEAVETVKKDQSDAATVSVNGTPTLFINGKKIVGAQPAAVFEQAIEEALKN